MSLAKRLNEMERRIRELQDWRASIEAAIAAEEEEDRPAPQIDLDGDLVPGERDQTQSLG